MLRCKHVLSEPLPVSEILKVSVQRSEPRSICLWETPRPLSTRLELEPKPLFSLSRFSISYLYLSPITEMEQIISTSCGICED
jgi:hypothetical protein